MFGQTWNHNRIDQEGLLKAFQGQVSSASILFQERMASGWNELVGAKYNKEAAHEILLNTYKKLEATKTQQQRLYWLHKAYKMEGKLNTMWDFYNMLTYFFTHVIEKGSRQKAMRLGADVANELMGELN